VIFWFAILIAINLQTSFLTPPFGMSLFYLKAIAGRQIAMATIFRGVLPFVLLQLVGLGLVMAFPEIALSLPDRMLN
jgi:TRAP-type mannitol/chloroaromatic compound transport system permease large subunit